MQQLDFFVIASFEFLLYCIKSDLIGANMFYKTIKDVEYQMDILQQKVYNRFGFSI